MIRREAVVCRDEDYEKCERQQGNRMTHTLREQL